MHAYDLRFAFRQLLRRPLFAGTAVMLIALAAAANGVVFSVVRGVLFKALPFAEPDRLVAIWPDSFVSNEHLGYWRDRTRSFEQIAGMSPGWLMALVASGHEPLKVTGDRVSDNFFVMLGVRPALGRTIVPGDGAPGAARVAVITFDIFERHFASDVSVIGRTIELDGAPHQIVGVMPRGFEFPDPGTDVWAPLTFDPSTPLHKATFSRAFGRLARGTTPENATRELVALTPAMRRELSLPNDWGHTLTVAPVRDTIAAGLQTTLLLLLGAVGLILLLAAINLGTLVLSHAVERAREMAVRSALGASRSRLMSQLLVEHAVVCSLGATIGLLLARLTLPLLVARIPAEMPRRQDVSLDAVVFLVVFAASLVVALAFAVVPVLLVARPRLQTLLRQTQSTASPARRAALASLVAAQLALAIVIGIGAGLMLRTLWNLQHVDPGFRPDGVLTFRLQTTSKYDTLSKGLPYFEQVLSRVRALPGVTSAGSIQHLPMTGYNWTADAYPVENPPPPKATPPKATWRFIGWDYFQTMRIPLRAGRVFTAFDNGRAPAVAIVNEAFARREFGSPAAALGRRLQLTTGRGAEVAEIVGVTGDVRYESLDTAARPEFYRPLAQTFMFPMAFVVRTSGDPAQLAPAIRQAAHVVDPSIPVAEMQPLGALVSGSLARPRLVTMLLFVFASAGLLLTIVGVYGVVAYQVRQHEREFGIRLALGATPRRIVGRVLGQGATFAGFGIVLALPLAWTLSSVMDSLVYGITPRDPLTFVALPLTILAVTMAASYWPARRAARVDPVTTMRAE